MISNVSGTIDVRGWDRNEVQVTGHLGRSVERLDLESSEGRTIVKVVLPHRGARDGDADIEVQVPKNSSVDVSAVSADVSSRGVLGTQRLKSVSGEVTADIAGNDSGVRSVSGDVTVRGVGKPNSLRVSSVSGSLDITNIGGKIEVVTVSGDARVQASEASEIRGRTTSGSLELFGKLTRDARVDVEGVSGDLMLRLVGARRSVGRDRIVQRRHRRLPGQGRGARQQVRPRHPAQPANRGKRRPRARQDALRRHRALRSLTGDRWLTAMMPNPAADIVTMSAACVRLLKWILPGLSECDRRPRRDRRAGDRLAGRSQQLQVQHRNGGA